MVKSMKSVILKTALALALLIGGMTVLADGQSAAAKDSDTTNTEVSRTLDATLSTITETVKSGEKVTLN